VRAELPDLVRAFRLRALGAAAVAGALAIGGIFVLREDAPDLYDGLTSGAGLACVIVSGLAGVVTLVLEWRERFEPARYTATAAVAAIVAGWGFAQEPYLLPPGLTVEEAAASDATLAALVISAFVGLALLLPALGWLFRLAVTGRLAYEEEPRP
jgi:cytochrome d ubiquinol oxidase subunit II